MRSSTPTVISYGKNPRARYHNKPQYYTARHIVDSNSLTTSQTDMPDYQSKPVPIMPGISSFSSQVHKSHKSSQHSTVDKNKKSEVKSLRGGSHIEFERLYYTELEKTKALENKIVELMDVKDLSIRDKSSIKEHYEDLIKQLQNESSNARSLENKYKTLENKKRSVEEELHKMKVELEVFKQIYNNKGEDEIIEELRKCIRTLNHEKNEFLNTIELNRTEISNYKNQINYYSKKEKENENKNSNIDDLKIQLISKQNEINELKNDIIEANKSANCNQEKDNQLLAKNFEIEKLKAEIKQLKNQIDLDDQQIHNLETRLQTLDLQKTTINGSLVKDHSPIDGITFKHNQITEKLQTHIEPTKYETVRYETVRRESLKPEPIRLDSYSTVYSPLRKTYRNSPIIVNEVLEHKTNCCCCERCAYCISKRTRTKELVTSPDDNRTERHTLKRHSRAESVNEPYQRYQHVERYKPSHQRETRSVCRYETRPSYDSPVNVPKYTTKTKRSIYGNENVNELNTLNTMKETKYTHCDDLELSPRISSKSYELYKYAGSNDNLDQNTRNNSSNNNIVYRKIRTSASSKCYDPVESPKIEYRYSATRDEYSDNDGYNVFSDGFKPYNRGRFSEYNY